MSATTPALRGGIGSQRLAAALAATALAIVVLVAIAGVMAVANRTTTAAPAPAPAPASLHDRGWETDGSTIAAPAVVLPRVFDPYHNDVVTPVEPGHHGVGGPLRRTNNATPTNGGRGTRMEQ